MQQAEAEAASAVRATREASDERVKELQHKMQELHAHYVDEYNAAVTQGQRAVDMAEAQMEAKDHELVLLRQRAAAAETELQPARMHHERVHDDLQRALAHNAEQAAAAKEGAGHLARVGAAYEEECRKRHAEQEATVGLRAEVSVLGDD
jgi:hypothetical protein